MKAILKFDLAEPDERESHMRCIKALDMALAIMYIGKVINRALDTSENGKTINGIDLQTEVNDILLELDINMDSLIS